MYIKKKDFIEVFKLWKEKVENAPDKFYFHDEFGDNDKYAKGAYKIFKKLLKEVQEKE